MRTYRLLVIVIGVFIYCSLTAQGNAGNQKPSTNGTDTDSSVTKFLLDFENFDWTTPSKKDTVKVVSTEAKKDTSDSGLFDFSNFSWNTTEPAKKAELTITIGTQTWSAQNLDVSTFRNGDVIRESKNSSEWEAAYYKKEATWCYYNFDAANGPKYGKLYNLYAVADAKGLAPVGWHIPNKTEWETMMAATLADGSRLKGTNEGGYGFVQGGYLGANDFMSIGILGGWWSSTKTRVYGAYGSSVNDAGYGYTLHKDQAKFYGGDYSTQGLSVKCVRD